MVTRLFQNAKSLVDVRIIPSTLTCIRTPLKGQIISDVLQFSRAFKACINLLEKQAPRLYGLSLRQVILSVN